MINDYKPLGDVLLGAICCIDKACDACPYKDDVGECGYVLLDDLRHYKDVEDALCEGTAQNNE